MKSQHRPTYSLASSGGSTHNGKEDQLYGRKNNHRRRNSDDFDPSDNASLTYSAASSVASGGSAAGESTDSSFADVMRVLDMQDSQELRDFIKKEGVTSISELKSRRLASGEQSVASSLAYSMDGESTLAGSKLLQTITGQPSDGFGYDGASVGKTADEELEGELALLFAPAEHGRIRKKKKNKNQTTPDAGEPSGNNDTASSTPPSKKVSSSQSLRDASPSPSVDTPTKSPPADRATPPPHPKRRFHIEDAQADDEIWYAKWWMFCFPDAARNLMPKR